MSTPVERPIPEYTGYYARDDGTIRTPSGHILRGHISKTCKHLRVWAKKRYWRKTHLTLVHRLIALAFVYNPRLDIFHLVDHINRDVNDNRPCNLRWVNHVLNGLNNDACGATFNKRMNKWHARVCVSGKSVTIGWYDTKDLGHQAAKAFRERAFNTLYLKLINEAPPASEYFFWKPKTAT